MELPSGNGFHIPCNCREQCSETKVLTKQLNTNDFYHNHKPSIALIKSNVRGLFGSMFCDLGTELNVVDVNVVEAQMGIISSVLTTILLLCHVWLMMKGSISRMVILLISLKLKL